MELPIEAGFFFYGQTSLLFITNHVDEFYKIHPDGGHKMAEHRTMLFVCLFFVL
jgi:Rps23 Pro-64 3,4-dihydroxylase Tpa1-like proline 4-hydroxylase